MIKYLFLCFFFCFLGGAGVHLGPIDRTIIEDFRLNIFCVFRLGPEYRAVELDIYIFLQFSRLLNPIQYSFEKVGGRMNHAVMVTMVVTDVRLFLFFCVFLSKSNVSKLLFF